MQCVKNSRFYGKNRPYFFNQNFRREYQWQRIVYYMAYLRRDMEQTIHVISLFRYKLHNIEILKKGGSPPYGKCIAARLECGDL